MHGLSPGLTGDIRTEQPIGTRMRSEAVHGKRSKRVLRKHGCFKEGLAKVRAAREIGECMDPDAQPVR